MGKMGRPTKYQHKFVKQAEKYLQECQDMRKVPFLEEFADRIGVNGSTLWRWTEARADFCNAIECIKDYQHLALMKLGLKSPAVIIFLLKANYGMIEASKVQHEDKGGEPLNIIFTDSTTWERSEKNRKKLEETNGVVKAQVQPQKTTEVAGGYDWTDYSKIAVDENGQNLI